MTQTSTLCSHRSISQSCGELWSMPCIISWAPVLQLAFHSMALPALLIVVLRRLPEPAARKIAAQEPPSSAGHHDGAPRLPRSISTGPDSTESAPSACRRRRPRAHLRRLRRGRWAARLGAHRLFMVFVASSAKPARGSRQTPSSCVIAADVIPCSFQATTRSKMGRSSIISPLPPVRCAYNVSIYNLEAVEISVCSKHSAGEKWPQPWTAGRRVTSKHGTT